MKRIAMMFGFLSAMTLAGAASAADCDTTSCVGVAITRIFAGSNGDIEYQVDGNTRGLTCTNEPTAYLKLPATHANFDTISKMASEAFRLGKRVWFRMDTAVCDISYLVLDL